MILLIVSAIIGWLMCGFPGYAIQIVVDEARGKAHRFWVNGLFGPITLLFSFIYAIRKALKTTWVAFGKPAQGVSYYAPPRGVRY